MKVLKFGGSSLKTGESHASTSADHRRRPGGKVVVVSAVSGVTESLLQFVAQPRKENEVKDFIKELRDLHIRAAAGRRQGRGHASATASTGWSAKLVKLERMLYGIMLPGGGHAPHQGLRPMLRGEARASSWSRPCSTTWGSRRCRWTPTSWASSPTAPSGRRSPTWTPPAGASFPRCRRCSTSGEMPDRHRVLRRRPGRLGHGLRPQRFGLLGRGHRQRPRRRRPGDLEGCGRVHVRRPQDRAAGRAHQDRSPTRRRPSWPTSAPRSSIP